MKFYKESFSILDFFYRVIIEQIAGVIVEQEMRDCSSSLHCQQPKRLCDIANATGLVKRCDVHCCKEDLCNKKEETKPTLEPQSVTQKGMMY